MYLLLLLVHFIIRPYTRCLPSPHRCAPAHAHFSASRDPSPTPTHRARPQVDDAPGLPASDAGGASGASGVAAATSGAVVASADVAVAGLPQCAAVAAAGAAFLVAWEAKKGGGGQWSGVYGDTLYNRYHAAYCGAHALWPFGFHRGPGARPHPPPPRGVLCPAVAWQLAGYDPPTSERGGTAPAAAIGEGEAE